ncbi:MAG: hypothetical protein M5R36_13585 [Deltaproteobacteria bacterium]|nr:hypothetical protein [Deltaproteobacteria bacterium]
MANGFDDIRLGVYFLSHILSFPASFAFAMFFPSLRTLLRRPAKARAA